MSFDIGHAFTFGCLIEATISDMSHDFAKVKMERDRSIPCSILQEMHDEDWEYTGHYDTYPDYTGHKTIREYLFKRIDRGVS